MIKLNTAIVSLIPIFITPFTVVVPLCLVPSQKKKRDKEEHEREEEGVGIIRDTKCG